MWNIKRFNNTNFVSFVFRLPLDVCRTVLLNFCLLKKSTHDHYHHALLLWFISALSLSMRKIFLINAEKSDKFFQEETFTKNSPQIPTKVRFNPSFAENRSSNTRFFGKEFMGKNISPLLLTSSFFFFAQDIRVSFVFVDYFLIRALRFYAEGTPQLCAQMRFYNPKNLPQKILKSFSNCRTDKKNRIPFTCKNLRDLKWKNLSGCCVNP